MLYIAIDQHARHLTTNIRDESGQVIQRRQVSTRPPAVRKFLTDLQAHSEAAGGAVVILEVCGFNDWLIELLREDGGVEIVLVQPEKRGRQKTDRRDANALGEVLWVNRHRLAAGQRVQGVRRVHIANPQDQEDRRLTAARQQVGQELTRTLNRIKHLLRRHNLQHHCPTKGIKTQRARVWLTGLPLGEQDRVALDHLLGQWDLLERYAADLEAQIARRHQQHPTAKVLRSIPGAGAYTALGLACRVGPIERFARPRSLANFWGLAPGVNDSGETTGRVGSITKRGSATARFLLGQLITHVLRKDPHLRQWFRQVRRRRGSKVARVAAMRRLTTIIWHMLQTGRTYRSVCAGVSAPRPATSAATVAAG
jgi:transposase